MKFLRIILGLALCLMFVDVRLAAVAAPAGALERRAQEVAALFGEQAGGYQALFAPSFLAQVPAAKLDPLFASLRARLGPVTGVRLLDEKGGVQGRFAFTFREAELTADLAIDPSPPHLITGLLLGAPRPRLGSMGDVVKQLETLPGKVSFQLVRLADGKQPEVLAALNPDEPLAVGSTFKLYILAELLRQIEAGKRRWTDVVELQEAARSLPSGQLHQWPAGAPLTLHSLASLMISVSDNTATDQLLITLGREKVEQALAAAGHARPERTTPFLSTLEMFKLKGDPQGRAGAAYVARDATGRRAFLAAEVAQMPRDAIVFTGTGPPAYIGSIEWFASAADLCRAMAWLWEHSATPATAAARGVLAINPGLSFRRQDWPYVGYKGGSEPGVLNLTYLLRSAGGNWFAFSVSWNNPATPVDDTRLFGLVEKIGELIPR